jgi:DNA-binding response OmpR family regulator
MMRRVLEGHSVLLLEDEYLIASMIAVALENAGARVFGPVSDLQRAMEIATDRSLALDAAVLDINLCDGTAFPAADIMLKRNVPVVFVTGYDPQAVPTRYRSLPFLSKPCDERKLISTLAAITGA